MVSIIVSSYQEEFYQQFAGNVAETIGVPYEIIKIPNKGVMGVSEAYNKGASEAGYPYLCFVHEDVLFKTDGWATPLIAKFKNDSETGIIGIAGSAYKTLAPGGWNTFTEGLDHLHIIQHSQKPEGNYTRQMPVAFQRADCLDGVFLFTTRRIWEATPFDQATFNHYHCYDIDFSFAVSLIKQNYVTNQVLIEHFSIGSYDRNWIDATLKFHRKWEKYLPKGQILNAQLQKKIEWDTRLQFLLKMANLNIPFFKALQGYYGYGFLRFFSLRRAIGTLISLTTAYWRRNK